MTNFNLGALSSWHAVTMGELYAFEVLQGDIRHVEFEFMADTPVRVTAVQGEEVWPIAVGDGHSVVKFTVSETVGIVFDGDPSSVVAIKTRDLSQIFEDDGEVSFTTVEPRGREVPDQMRRYMMMMNLNQRNREAAMRAEFEARLAEQAEVIERERAPSLVERQKAAAEAQVAELEGAQDSQPETPAPAAK